MKKQAFKHSLIGGLVAAFVSVAAYGQPAHLGVHIPFEFTAGQTTFPAGQYTLAPALTSHPKGALLIRRAQGGPAAAICLTMAVATRDVQEKSKLVFHRYGQRYFLYQVWRAGDDRGYEFRASPLEQELVRSGIKPQTAFITEEKLAVEAGKGRAERSHRPSN